jgi:hypothetical protein
MLRGLKSIFSRLQVLSFFLVGPEHPFQRSYFVWVHTRKVPLGPTTRKRRFELVTVRREVLAADLNRSRRQLRSVDDDPDKFQIHRIGLKGRNRFEWEELASRRIFVHWPRNQSKPQAMQRGIVSPSGTGEPLLGPCKTPAFRFSRFGAPFGAVFGRVQERTSALPQALGNGPPGKNLPETSPAFPGPAYQLDWRRVEGHGPQKPSIRQ